MSTTGEVVKLSYLGGYGDYVGNPLNAACWGGIALAGYACMTGCYCYGKLFGTYCWNPVLGY